MTTDTDALGLPVGPVVDGWTARPVPPRTPLEGRTCRVEPVSIERQAWRQNALSRHGSIPPISMPKGGSGGDSPISAEPVAAAAVRGLNPSPAGALPT